jgi:small subunit ribosomal protein S17
MIENEETPETPETPPAEEALAEDAAPEADAAAEQAALEEPPAEEPPAEEPPAEAPPAEEPAAEAPPAEEPPAEAPAPEEPAAEAPPAEPEEPAAPAAVPTPPQEPAERLHPKEARRRARSRNEGDARPARTPEERQAEREEARRRKAAERRAYRVRGREKAKQRPSVPAPPLAEKPAGRRKVRLGIVVGDKADKTITVRTEIARRHRRYEKIVRSTSTLHAHDEANDAHIGDTVRVVESRPLSRTKRWRLEEVLERAR